MKNFVFPAALFFALAPNFSHAEDEPPSQLVVLHSHGSAWPKKGEVSFDDPRVQEHGKYWGSQSIVEKKAVRFPEREAE